MHDHQHPRRIVVDIQRGVQLVAWLVVHADGRIRYHRDEWADLDEVARRWPDKVAAVHLALTRMNTD